MKKYFLGVVLVLLVIWLVGCNKQEMSEENSETVSTGNALLTTHLYTVSAIPLRVRALGVDEPKLIGLQEDLSYHKIVGENYFSSVVFYDTAEAIKRESERLIGENNLQKKECTPEEIQEKIENDERNLSILWTEQSSLDTMKQKILGEEMLCYYKSEEKDNTKYSIRLLVGEEQMIIDTSYDKILNNMWYADVYRMFVGKNDRCDHIVLQDRSWNILDVPEELEENLSWCGDESVVISPNYQFIFFNYMSVGAEESRFLLYNREDQKLHTLGYEDGEIEWIKCLRNQNNKDIACAIVNQQKYPWLTKMIVFSINEKWESIGAQEFIQEPWESIDFMCWDSCYVGDFWFARPFEIQYAGHREISSWKTYSIWYK